MTKANEQDGMTNSEYLFGVKNKDKSSKTLNNRDNVEKQSKNDKIVFIIILSIIVSVFML